MTSTMIGNGAGTNMSSPSYPFSHQFQSSSTVGYDGQPEKPTLPSELITKIIVSLQQDRLYATLAKMAQVNSKFYHLVIPKLYETVTITDRNVSKISRDLHPLRQHKNTQHVDHHTMVHVDGKCNTDPEEPVYDMTKTRKDRAIEWCRRLIIDTPTNDLMGSIHYIMELLPNDRFGDVDEVVFTTEALGVPESDEAAWCLGDILSPIAPIGQSRGTNDQLPKAKRLVLHLFEECELDWMQSIHPFSLQSLSEWNTKHREDRRPTEFVMYNLELCSSEYHFDHMQVLCHFVSYGLPPCGTSQAIFLNWLLGLFVNPDISSWPRLTLFDVYNRFFLADENVPENPAASSEHVRNLVERSLRWHMEERGLQTQTGEADDEAESQAILIKAIMERLSFHQGEVVEMYPFLKPKPVTQSEPSIRQADEVDTSGEDEDEGL